jgi:branched-chain amino acid aminotransferase
MAVILARIQADGVMKLPTPAASIAEAAQLEPEGVYTVARTYHGDQVVLLDAHLNRLERSAYEEHVPVRLDRPALRHGLRQLIESAGFPETRFRLTLPSAEPGVILVALEPLPPPAAKFRDTGVRVCSVEFHRPQPSVKTNQQEAQRAKIRQSMPAGIFEGLILGPRHEILEGLTSNFFAVKDAHLYTAGGGVLAGISRQIVLEVAPSILPVHMEPVSLHQIPELDEAFMSSSSRGVLPIVEVNSLPIGSARPGRRTLEIMRAYDVWVAGHLEAL